MLSAVALASLAAAAYAAPLEAGDSMTPAIRPEMVQEINAMKTTWKAAIPSRFSNATLADVKVVLGTIMPGEEGYYEPAEKTDFLLHAEVNSMFFFVSSIFLLLKIFHVFVICRPSLHPSMCALSGLSVPTLLVTSVIRATVAHAGLSAPPKPSMTDTASRLVTARPFSLPRTPTHAALAPPALAPWAAMVASPLVPGSGSPPLVYPLAVTGLMLDLAPHASPTACSPALTTSSPRTAS